MGAPGSLHPTCRHASGVGWSLNTGGEGVLECGKLASRLGAYNLQSLVSHRVSLKYNTSYMKEEYKIIFLQNALPFFLVSRWIYGLVNKLSSNQKVFVTLHTNSHNYLVHTCCSRHLIGFIANCLGGGEMKHNIIILRIKEFLLFFKIYYGLSSFSVSVILL